MWVDEELATDRKQREEKWTKSIAVGSKEFVNRVQNNLGGRANGRNIQGDEVGYQLREPSETYIALSEDEKDDMGSNNAYIWGNCGL